jgi:hypothetical protein
MSAQAIDVRCSLIGPYPSNLTSKKAYAQFACLMSRRVYVRKANTLLKVRGPLAVPASSVIRSAQNTAKDAPMRD